MKPIIKFSAAYFKFILCLLLSLSICQIANAKPGGGGGKKNNDSGSSRITILEHPSSYTVQAGDTVSFSISATVRKGPGLKYQWFLNGAPINAATRDVYTVQNVEEPDAGEYYVQLTSGDHSATSQSATLSVQAPEMPTEPVPTVNNPPIANNDISTTNEDMSVIIDVLANDSDLDGHALTVINSEASNGTTSITPDGSLNYIPSLDFNGSDFITYTIADTEGATASAVVEVEVIAVEDLRITYQPSSASIFVGNSHTLNVSAIGEGELSYQWYKDGTQIEGANLSYLPISEATIEDSGLYEVVVTDDSNSSRSDAAAIQVNHKPVIQLSWSTPEFREDGSPLDQNEIAAFFIYYQQESTGTEHAIEVSGDIRSHNILELDSDNYTFWISTVDINGAEGSLSSNFQISL